MKNKVFLGGTCNNTTWRNELIPELKIDYFNPIVDKWTTANQAIEIDEKENRCNVHLYVITSKMTGVFSIAEAVDSAHNKAKTTIFHVLPDGFSDSQLKSLDAVVNLIKSRGGIAYIGSDLMLSARTINYLFSL